MKFVVSLIVFLISMTSCNLYSQAISDTYDESFRKNEILVQADSLAVIWQYEKAIVKYKLAKDRFKRSDHWEAYVYSLSRIGEMYLNTGDKDNAIIFLEKARKEGKEHLDAEHPEMGRVYYYLSDYFDDEPELSLVFCEKSLKIRKTKLDSNHLDIADSYIQLGAYSAQNRNFENTLELYQQALNIYEIRLDAMSLRLGRAYRRYASVQNDFHDTDGSLHYLSQARKIFDTNPNSHTKDRAIVYNNLANRHFDKGEFAPAIPLYSRSLEFIVPTFGPNSVEFVTALGNLGMAYSYLEEDDKARNAFRKVFSIVEQSPLEFQQEVGYLYEQYADFYLERAKPDTALTHINKAIHLDSQKSKQFKPYLASLMHQKALALKQKGEIDSSLAYIQKSLIYLEKDFETENHYANPSITNTLVPDKLYKGISLKADIFYSLYEMKGDVSLLKEAISLYTKLDSLADRMRNEIWSAGSKLFFKQYYKQDADRALSAIYQLDKLSPDEKYKDLVFRFMEKNRYSKIYNNQSRALNLSKGGRSDSLHQKQQLIHSQLSDIKNSLMYESDSFLIDSLKEKSFKLNREAEILQTEFSKKYPNQFNVKFANMMTLDQVQKRLDQTTQIIEYSWGETTIFALVISKTNSFLFQIPLSDSLRTNIDTFKKYVSLQAAEGSEPVTDIKSYSPIAYKLYTKVIEPLLVPGKKHLIISSDGELSSLPFEALMTQPTATSWRTASYLLNNYNIQFALNFNLLYHKSSAKKKSEPDILAFAYTDPKKDSDLAITMNRGETLNPIEGSSKELDAIHRTFKEGRHAFLRGLNATETAFKGHIENFNIVHLALHGKADNDNELNSCLYFRDKPTSQDDGQLFAHELYQYNLSKLSLAVLSACESGRGKELKGEGIFNMARGFAVAGCESIVMSLWKINDNKTAEVMDFFYHNLRNGNHIHNALRDAKLDYIENAKVDKLTHPYYWSAFVPIGKSSPVCTSQNVYLIWGALTVISLLLFSFFIFKRFKN